MKPVPEHAKLNTVSNEWNEACHQTSLGNLADESALMRSMSDPLRQESQGDQARKMQHTSTDVDSGGSRAVESEPVMFARQGGEPSFLEEIQGIQRATHASLATATIQASEHCVNRDEVLGGSYFRPGDDAAHAMTKRMRSSGPPLANATSNITIPASNSEQDTRHSDYSSLNVLTSSSKRKQPPKPGKSDMKGITPMNRGASNAKKFKGMSRNLATEKNMPNLQGEIEPEHTYAPHEHQKDDSLLIDQQYLPCCQDEIPMTSSESESETDGFSPLPMTNHLYQEEADFLANVERRIITAETDELLEQIERKIDNAEINEILENTYQRIAAAEKREREKKTLGKVLCVDENLKDSKYPQDSFDETLWDISFYEDLPQGKSPYTSHLKMRHGYSCMVEDVVFFEPTECRAIKILPKFIGATNEHIFTDLLLNKLVNRVKKVQPGDLRVYLRNQESDSFSVTLEARGHEALVSASLHFIQQEIAARQLRYLSSIKQESVSIPFIDSNRQRVRSKCSTVMQISTKGKMSENSLEYRNFGVMVKEMKIKENEFWTIPLTTIKGSMWECHKSDIGPFCGVNCPCLFQLESLTRNVVKDFIRTKNQKDPCWSNPDGLIEGQYPVGFINHFIPKFRELLRAEFPGESPKELYHRAAAMWIKHQGSVQFGITCKKDCHCGEAWEIVFMKGKCGENTYLPSKPTKFLQSDVASIPRNKPSYKPGLLKMPPHYELPANNQHKEYVITFPTSDSMGFYCVTDTSRAVCKISSVNIKQRHDARLAIGTIILAAKISEARQEWIPISSHREIERIYENAKGRQEDISVRFINSEVKASSISQDTNGIDKEWTARGVWRGQCSTGWSGGAVRLSHTVPPIEAIATGTKSLSGHNPAVAITPLGTTAHARVDPYNFKVQQQQSQQPPLPQVPPTEMQLFEFLSTKGTALHRKEYNGEPSLRQPKAKWIVLDEKTANTRTLQRYIGPRKKIRFRKTFEKRFYSPSDLPFEMAIASKDNVEALTRASSQATNVIHLKEESAPPRPEALLEVVNNANKSYIEMFELLKQGANPTIASPTSKNPEFYIKENLSNLQSEINRCEEGSLTWIGLKKQLQEADHKKKLLKIYIIAQDVMNQARFLKSHERLDIQLVSSKSLCLTNLGIEREAENTVWWEVTLKDFSVPPTPPAELSSNIDWSHAKIYHCNENLDLAKTRGEESSIVFTLKKGEPSGVAFELGHKKIALREIRHAAMSAGELESELDASIYLKRCVLALKMKRKGCEKDYREKKRSEATRKLRELLQQIDSFVMETGNPKMESIAAEMWLSMPNAPAISLLHAAIYLDEPDFVEALVQKYGADPNSKKSRETPLALAEKKFDKVLEDPELKRKRSRIHRLLLCKTEDESESFANANNLSEGDEEDGIVVASSEQCPQTTNSLSSHTQSSNVDTSRTSSTCETQSKRGENLGMSHIFTSPNLNEGTTLSQVVGNCEPTAKHLNTDHERSYVNSRPNQSDFPQALDWMAPKTRGRCVFFGNASGCRRNRACFFSHIKQPLGQIVNTSNFLDPPPANLSEVGLRFRGTTSNGVKYFTAGYIDADKTRYYAEGGSTAIQVAGVFWYRTPADAEKAVQNVVHIHRYNLHQATACIGHEKSSESWQAGHVDPAKCTARDSPEQPSHVFRKLLHANLSNIYMMLYKKPLRRNNWSVVHEHGFYSAEFSAEVDGLIQHYKSIHHEEGEFHDGRWWYKTEMEAKASAFDSFLDHAAARGMVTNCKTRLIDGTKFKFM